MNAIELNNIQKSWPGFDLTIPRLVLPGGSILGLIGENGAGKTTTIKILLGLTLPQTGTVTLLGQDGQPAHITRQQVGVVLESAGFPGSFNVQRVGAVLQNLFTDWDDPYYRELLSRFSVPQDRPLRKMSRGQQMKLSLAAALAHRPKLLVLDEALAGLDPVARDDMLDLLRAFVSDEDHAVLISSHIVSDLERLCDYVAFLHRGRLALFAEKDRLLDGYGLLHCTAEELAALPEEAIRGKRVSPYGVEALVEREKLPAHLTAGPVGLEDLFVFMEREER